MHGMAVHGYIDTLVVVLIIETLLYINHFTKICPIWFVFPLDGKSKTTSLNRLGYVMMRRSTVQFGPTIHCMALTLTSETRILLDPHSGMCDVV